jgi:hypothetical protein
VVTSFWFSMIMARLSLRRAQVFNGRVPPRRAD